MKTPLEKRIAGLLRKHGHTEAAENLERESPLDAADCSVLPEELERWAKRMRWIHVVCRYHWIGVVAAIGLWCAGFYITSIIASMTVVILSLWELISVFLAVFLIRRHFDKIDSQNAGAVATGSAAPRAESPERNNG